MQLDIATTLDFAQGTVTNYESLLKSNVGIASLSGGHTYSAGTTIAGGTLDVNGSLITPTIAFTNVASTATLNIDGTGQASGATQTVITGSAATNLVNVNAGGTLLATGDLGAGDDVLDVAGTLNTGGGVFALADGDDEFVIHDATNLIGTVDGGTGFDSLNANIAGLADLGAVSTFEELIKNGAGTLNINGPAPSDFVSVAVQGGTLNVAPAGSLNGIQNATVASGATLIVDGSLSFTPGADLFTVAGEVRGLSTIDLLDGADTLTDPGWRRPERARDVDQRRRRDRHAQRRHRGQRRARRRDRLRDADQNQCRHVRDSRRRALAVRHRAGAGWHAARRRRRGGRPGDDRRRCRCDDDGRRDVQRHGG